MKTRLTVVLVLSLLVLAGLATAGDAKTVTVEGKIACAKCTLKIEGAGDDCQSVLVVKKGKGDPTYYYLVDNDVAGEYGHVCQGEKAAIVTGTVKEKDGQMWLTATKMKAPKDA